MIRIVLVDTDDIVLALNTSLCNRAGFNVTIASSGQDVLQMVKDEAPDLIFLDMDLPDMSGAACCRAVKVDSRSSHIPVVMFAPPERELDIELCRHVGCNAILYKPVRHKDFVSTVRKFIEVTERANPRYPVQLTVQYGPDARQIFSSFSANLSPGGLFLVADTVLAKDTRLTMEFVLPGSERRIRCKARVAWVNHVGHSRKWSLPVGMGVQFVEMLPEDAELIRDFVIKSKSSAIM